MRLFIFITFFSSVLNADVNFALKSSVEIEDFDRQKLLMAISLTIKTKIGKELKPHIDELMRLGKIRLSNLQKGHYGESGEGCVIKAGGGYFYEGLFVLLSDKLSIPELASSLVHEVSHYRMIKELVELGDSHPIKVSAFEISAFASQYEFIKELEQLKLIDHQSMFTDDAQAVSDIMHNAYRLRTNWSRTGYDTVFKQLLDFGYPYSELNRTIIQRTEKECINIVELSDPQLTTKEPVLK